VCCLMQWHRLDGLTAVLGTALDLREENDRVSIVPKNELVAEARGWSGLPYKRLSRLRSNS